MLDALIGEAVVAARVLGNWLAELLGDALSVDVNIDVAVDVKDGLSVEVVDGVVDGPPSKDVERLAPVGAEEPVTLAMEGHTAETLLPLKMSPIRVDGSAAIPKHCLLIRFPTC